MSEKRNDNQTCEDFSVNEHNCDNYSDSTREAVSTINKQRSIIDDIDERIIELLGQRFRATETVGEIKASVGFAALDSSRESQQAKRMISLADKYNLDSEISLSYLSWVVDLSKKRHQEIAQNRIR